MYPFRSTALVLMLFFCVSSKAQFLNTGYPQSVIDPDTVYVSMTQCNDSVSIPITIGNTGTGPLLYNIVSGQEVSDRFENGTTNWVLEGEWGLSTYAYTGEYSLAVSPQDYYDNDWLYAATYAEELQVFDVNNARVQFWLYHDLYCCGGGKSVESEYYCDQLIAQISVNGGEFQDISSISCSNYEWQFMEIDFSSHVSNGDRFVFRFLFSSDDYGTSSGAFIDNFEITGSGPRIPWLSSINSGGLAEAGTSVQIPLLFKSEGVVSGHYSMELAVETSDSANPLQYIYLDFILDGDPLLTVSNASFDFGEVQENGQGFDTLYLLNSGCDSLHISGYALNDPHFSIENLPAAIAAFEQHPVLVRFNPDSSGIFFGNLNIQSDGGAQLIALNGTGISAPHLVVSPPFFSDTISQCGDSVLVSLTLYNTGPVELNVHLEPEIRPISMDHCEPENYDYNCCGIGIYQVEFGSINHSSGAAASELNLDLTSQYYTKLEAGEAYPVRIHTGTENYENVRIWIDYNNNGIFETEELVFESINSFLSLHEGVILIPEQNVSYYTRLRMRVVSEYLYYSIPEACGPVYYGQYEDYAVVITGSSQIVATSTILPGDSLNVSFYGSSAGLTQGLHTQNLVLTSNDPLADTLIYAVNLWLEGTAELGISQGIVDFDTLSQHQTKVQTIDIFNDGCAPLIIPKPLPLNGLSAHFYAMTGDTAVILPGDTLSLNLVYSSDIPGDHAFLLPLLNNDADTSISIHAFIVPAAFPMLTPDSIQLVLENCNDSTTYPLVLHNQGLDTLHWYLAENIPGNALNFSGISSQQLCIDSVGSLPAQGTVEFWFTQDYTNYWDNMSVLSLSVNNFNFVGAGFDIRYYYDYLELIAGDSLGNYQYYTIASYLPKNQWNHVALSWDRDSDSLWIYFNGQLVLSAYQYYETTKAASMCLGKNGSSSNLFKGQLDEVRFWDVKRSSDQIRQFRNVSVAAGLPGLRAYYPMNEDSGSFVYDNSAHALHGTLTDISRVTTGRPKFPSPEYSADYGNIAPGDSAQVDVTIKTEGWKSGNHAIEIPFETNAPTLPVIVHHLNVQVLGSPQIALLHEEVAMDSVMVGLTKERLVTLTNTGCDTLEIMGILSSNPEFWPEEDTFYVLPFEQQDFFVYFKPFSAGFRQDTLYINSNAGSLAVPFSGTGLPAPDFVFSPDTLFLVSTACDVPVQGTILLSNTGAAPATYTMAADSGIFNEDFESGLGDWETTSGIWTNNGNGFQSNTALHFYSGYNSELFSFIDLKKNLQVIDPDNVIISADILQNLACSWYGYDYLIVYVSRNGSDYEAKYSITCNNINYTHRSFQLNDVNPGDILRFRIALQRYGYYSYNYGNIDNFRVTGVSQTPGFAVVAQSDTLQPDSTQQLVVTFTNTNMSLGTNISTVTVGTSSPLQPLIQIPVVVDFQGEAHSMAHSDTLDFGYQMATSTTILALEVENTGCDTLEMLSVSNQNPVFTPLFTPESVFIHDFESIDIQFHPTVAGYYLDTLEIITNAEPVQVILRGYAGLAPKLQFSPDTLLVDAACGDIVSLTLDLHNSGDTLLNWAMDPFKYDGLLVYYPFQSGVNDFSGNNRHLTENGTLPARGFEDKDNTARQFSGTQYLQYNNEGDVEANLFVPYATVSLWVKADGVFFDFYQKLFFLNYGLDIGISSGVISVYASGTNSEYFALEAPFVYNEWVHVAITFDGTSFILYLNGQEIEKSISAPCELEYYTYNKRLEIGTQGGNGLYYGLMDEVRFYNRPLSAAEIQALYTSTLNHYLVIEANPVQGSLSPGMDAISTISLNTTWLKEGMHSGFIYFSSNDPEQQFSGIPYKINVSGEPSPQWASGCKDFGSAFVNELKTDSIQVFNEGCRELVLYSLSTNTGNFVVESDTFSIEPFNNSWIRVSFIPDASGIYSDTLHISSNAGMLHHCLNGSSPGKPSLQINSGLFTRILACTNTATDEILVTNTGTETLEVFLQESPVLNWLYVPVNSLSILPGQQGIIPLEFNRLGISSGVYTRSLTFLTNDPDYPMVTVQVHLLISNTYYTANLGNDTAFCAGTSYLLNPGYFSTYLWNTGLETPTLTVTEPGIYTVSVSDISGCISSDSISVGVVDAPLVFAGSDTIACTGKSLMLIAQVLNPLPLHPKTGIIGSGGTYYSGVDANPMSTAYTNRRTQYFYEAYELIQAGFSRGNITSIGFNLKNTDGIALNDYSVSIAFVSSYNPTYSNFVTTLTQVYHADIQNPVNGWNILQFDTPVYWDGTQHMIVQICHNNATVGTSPEYLYSYKYRGVVTNYCYNCGSLCSSGSYGWILHTRPVIQLGMEVDINQYTWEGPNGFFTHEPNAFISSVENYYAGTYQLTIDNGYSCTGTDEMVIAVNPSPVLDLGTDQTILGWDTTTLQAGVSAAPGPYNFSWSPATGLNYTDSAQVNVFINQSITYTVDVVSANGCTDQDQITLNVIPRYPLSGKLTYANVFQTPLPESTVYRLNGELQITDSASTNTSGDYEFPLLPVNTNNFGGTSELTPGGINATDALLVARHITGAQIMSGVRLQAADVNGSNTWSAADALLILHRTAGNIPTFPAGDWTVEKRSVNHQAPSSVVNLTALSFGDVNGSFTPGLKAEPTLSLRSDDFVLASEKELVPVPVTLSSDIELGALTLSLGYDPAWMKVEAVSSPLDGLISNINANEIRLAWYDVDGVSLKGGDVIAVLWIATNGNHNEQESAFRLEEDGELADKNARIHYDREIRIPRIRYENEPPGIFYLGQNQPNPFSEETVIPFSLPEEGIVRFDIFSLLGEHVQSGTTQQYDSGAHYWHLDASGLKAGMYLYRFTFKGKTLDYQQTRTLILSR